MYKIMIHIDTHTNDTWFYYQEEGKDYVANSLEEIKETVLTLIDVYGEDYIKIVKQETGDDMSGSVETFLYNSTDNYEELVNRPFINGVEIVGALSLAELGIQPVGNYATNERVDQVEAKVDAIDLEPYATMGYLDEVVAGIDFSASNENITGVKTFSVLPRSTVAPITEDELTNKAYVDHGVENCASKEYVNEAIANIEIPEVDLSDYYTKEEVDSLIPQSGSEDLTEEFEAYSTRLTEQETKINDIIEGLSHKASSSGGRRSLITAGLFADVQSTSYHSSAVPLNMELNKKGSELSLDTTNNAIKIGAGVSKVLVSGTITQVATATGLYGGNIHKNGITLNTAVNVGFTYIPTINVFFKTTLSPVLVDVVEGDLLYLTTYAETNSPLTIKAYDGRSTNITVEVIE